MILADMLRYLFKRGGAIPEPPPLRPDEVRAVLSPGWVELPEGMEGRYPDNFLRRLNQPRKPRT